MAGRLRPVRHAGWWWLGLAITVAGAGLLPWMVYLAVSLPASTRAWHWPAAWTGLDAMEAVGLLATGLLALRRDVRSCIAALPTAGLLLADAWFDVTTAPPGGGELASLAMAIAAELPAAAVCLAIGVAGLNRLLAGSHRRGNDLTAVPPFLALRDALTFGIPAGRLGTVRILVVGSGGREHALVRALARDGEVTTLHAAPGNPGIGEIAELHDVKTTSPAEVAALARKLAADLVVIGPEAPLVAGVADAVRDAGLACFGPAQGAAMIEGSKSFAKQVMAAAGVPTAAARTCRTEAEAVAALAEFGPPYVVKADGRAGGKGVVVTADRTEALAHADATGTVVIEEFLDGPEVSVFALADGTDAVTLQPAQDFKRAGEGDEGPNTGGMGAYAPLPWAPADLAEQTLSAVVTPTLAELRRIGRPFSGLLYVGLCLTQRGLRVVEFNARFGDPETQVVLDRLGTPLGGLLAACASGDLAAAGPLSWLPGAAVTVVIAAEGYPVSPVGGDVIEGLADAGHVPGCYVLQSGTASDSAGRLTASGGRVLSIVGTGSELATARARAYEAAGLIRLRGGWFRRDIAAEPVPGTSARA